MSWLHDVIHMVDMCFVYNDTSEDKMHSDSVDSEDISTSQFIKVLAVILLVIIALVGNLLVIFSVFCNKAMR